MSSPSTRGRRRAISEELERWLRRLRFAEYMWTCTIGDRAGLMSLDGEIRALAEWYQRHFESPLRFVLITTGEPAGSSRAAAAAHLLFQTIPAYEGAARDYWQRRGGRFVVMSGAGVITYFASQMRNSTADISVSPNVDERSSGRP